MTDAAARLRMLGLRAGVGGVWAGRALESRGSDAAEPVGILRVAAAEGEDGVGQSMAAGVFRVHSHDNGAVAALGDRNPLVGKVCGIHCRKPGRGWGCGDLAEGWLPRGAVAHRGRQKYASPGRLNPVAPAGERSNPPWPTQPEAAAIPYGGSFLLFWMPDSPYFRDSCPVRSAIV